MRGCFVFLSIALFSGCLSLGTKKEALLDCRQPKSLHPKYEAVCTLQTAIKLKSHSKVSKAVEKYRKMDLKNSGYYQSILVAGQGSGSDLRWVYLVGVEYNDLKTFRSVVAVVQTYVDEPARILEVVEAKEIDKWIQ